MLELFGKHADLMLSRLKSWRLDDDNGLEGDALTLTLHSDGIEGLPPRGELYQVALNGVVRDTFSICQRSFSLSPGDIRLVLTLKQLK